MTDIEVETSVEIALRREVVAKFAAEPDNAPEWYATIQSIVWETQRPMRVGSRFTFVTRFLGQRYTFTYEVAEWHAQRFLVMRTVEGPFPIETAYMWDALDDGRTRMVLRNRLSMDGVAALVRPLVGAAVRRANAQALERLKHVLEERAQGEA